MNIAGWKSNPEADPETWLWIGPRDSEQWNAAYQKAESTAGQIAFRANIEEALMRSCAPADRIIIAKQDSAEIATDRMQALRDAHPAAEFIRVTGVCCAADPAEVRLDPNGMVPWHQAVDRMVGPSNAATEESSDATDLPKSVGIIASQLVDAEILLDIAGSVGVTAFWFRSAQECTARNVDAFWWDDSVLNHSRPGDWTTSLESIRTLARPHAKHTWLVGLPNPKDIRLAKEAGMNHVLSKPVHVPALLNQLLGRVPSVAASARVAA